MNIALQKYYLQILGKRDYSEQILREKALQKGYPEEEIEESLIWLKQKNFVNEVRLAENLVNFYQLKKGKNWISLKLKTKKIQNQIIQEALQNFVSYPSKELKSKIAKKYKLENFENIEINLKYKILGFLQRQGYNNASEILAKWTNQDN